MQLLNGLAIRVRDHPFLSGLDPRFQKAYVDCGTIRRFASHQHIFSEGGEADHFYLICTGKVALESYVPGEGMVLIQPLGPGDALGWSWMFEPYVWQFTARTELPTEVLSFDATALRIKAEEDMEFQNDFLRRITKTLVDRLQATRLKLIDPSHARVVHSDIQSL